MAAGVLAAVQRSLKQRQKLLKTVVAIVSVHCYKVVAGRSKLVLAPGRFWARRTPTAPLHLHFLSFFSILCTLYATPFTAHFTPTKPETLPTSDPSLATRGPIGRLTTLTLSISLLPQHLTVAASIAVLSFLAIDPLFLG
jgi:hypothetical protein